MNDSVVECQIMSFSKKNKIIIVIFILDIIMIIVNVLLCSSDLKVKIKMSKIKRGDFMTKERSQILIRKTCLVAFDILSVIIAFFLSSIIAYNGHIELSFLRYSYYLLSGLIVSSLIFFVYMIVYGDMLLSMNY